MSPFLNGSFCSNQSDASFEICSQRGHVLSRCELIVRAVFEGGPIAAPLHLRQQPGFWYFVIKRRFGEISAIGCKESNVPREPEVVIALSPAGVRDNSARFGTALFEQSILFRIRPSSRQNSQVESCVHDSAHEDSSGPLGLRVKCYQVPFGTSIEGSELE